MLKTHVEGENTLPKDMDHLPMSEALGHLRALKVKEVDEAAEPGTLYREQVEVLSNVFQLRTGSLNTDHVKTLTAVIVDKGEVDPVLVWRCGAYVILIDGHHRLAAYEKAERKSGERFPIPVNWF